MYHERVESFLSHSRISIFHIQHPIPIDARRIREISNKDHDRQAMTNLFLYQAIDLLRKGILH